MNDKQASKLREYLQTMIKLQITIHQNCLRIPRVLQNIVFLFGAFQSVSFLLRPDVNTVNQPQQDLDIIYFQLHLSRPDLIITEVFTFINYSIYFTLPFVVILAFDVIFLHALSAYYLHHNKKTQLVREQLKMHTSIISMMIFLYSAYSQLFLVYFKIPAYCLTINTIIESYNQSNIVGQCFGCLTFILIFLIDQSKEAVCRESYSLSNEGFVIIEYNKSDIMIQFLTISQVVIYFIGISSSISTALQTIIIILFSLVKIYQTIHITNLTRDSARQIQIFAYSISLTYAVCYTANYSNLFIILCPLLMTLIQAQSYYKVSNLLVKLTTLKLDDIKLYIVLMINDDDIRSSKLFQIAQAINLRNHRSKCRKLQCWCQDDALVNEPIMNFQRQMLKLLHTEIMTTQRKSKKVDTTDILFYAASLHYYGFTILAFQQVMNQLNGTQQEIKYKQHIKDIRLTSSKSVKSSHSDSKLQSLKEKHDMNNKIIAIRQRTLGFIERIKLDLLKLDITNNLMENFMKKSDFSQLQITEVVSLFLESEQDQQQIKASIISLLQQKIQFSQQLQAHTSSTDLYDRAIAIGKNFLRIENDLIRQYERFPSQKLQGVICFLESEILNDYLKAFKYANFTTITDEKLINLRKNLKLNLFSNKITYINIKVGDNLEALQIQYCSNNAHLFFDYTYEEFKKQQYLNFLIPDAVVNEHNLFITRFIQTGFNKFFRSQSLNFFKMQNGFLQQFDLLFDINNYVSDGIYFAVFCQSVEQNAAHILVDINLQVSGISKNFFEKLGYRQRQIKDNASILVQSYQLPIQKLLPQFDTLSQTQQKQFNVTMYTIDVLNVNSVRSMQFKTISQQKSHDDEFVRYDASLSIHQREIYGMIYYMIEIDDLRQSMTSVKSGKSQKVYNTHEQEKPENLSSNSLDISVEEAQAQFANPVEIKQLIELNDIKQQLNPDQSVVALTPNQSQNRLLDQNFNFIQQTFFNAEMHNEDKESQSVSKNDENDRLEKVNNLDRNMEQEIQNQLYQENENQQIDDQGSMVSSLAGVRKSAHYKKYDVVQQMILKSNLPNSFKFCVFQIVIFFAVSSLYNIIILQQNSTDLKRFIQQINMLSFDQSFMAPFGMFTSSRLMQNYYITDLSRSYINQTVYNLVYPWTNARMKSSYDWMRENFQTSFENQYLNDFFNDEYLQSYYQDTSFSDLVLKNQTFKEALFQLLNYQFQYKIMTKYGTTNTNTPFQTFTQVNYFILTNKFETMTENILYYTQDGKDMISQKWWIESGTFISVAAILLIVGYLAYLKFISNYDSYLELFTFAEPASIQKDIDRYKILLSLLTKDSDVMFKYVFELDAKEQFIINHRNQQNQQLNNHKQILKTKSIRIAKLPVYNSLIGFLFIYAFFFATAAILTLYTQSYLNKYKETTIFYKQMADLDTRVCGIYGDLLLSTVIVNFPYFAPKNQTDLQNRILNSAEVLANFSQLAQTLNPSQYLFSPQFTEIFGLAKTESICSLLSESDYDETNQFCNTAFDGALNLGMSSALNFIINEIQNYYSLNKFTSRRLGTLTYSVQGAYILNLVIQTLITDLQSGMMDQTNNQQTLTNTFCIIYLVYTFLFLIILLHFMVQYYDQEYYITKRFVLLMPSQTLLLNDNLERQLRIYIARDNK